jgi:hypothetical protein
VARPALTGTPNITGTARVGQVLTANTDNIGPAGIGGFTYQWVSSATTNGTFANIAGATNATYTPVAGDATRFIRVRVGSTNATAATVESASTTAVLPAHPPITGTPTITGAATFGVTLQANNGNVSPTTNLSRQWQRANAASGPWTDISGATGTSYTLGADDVTRFIRVRFTSTDATGEVFSAATAAVGRASQTTPGAPTFGTVTHNSIVVNAAAGAQVQRVGETSWHNAPHTFTGLAANTSFSFIARLPESATHNASSNSAPAGRSTAPQPVNADGHFWAGGLACACYSFGLTPANQQTFNIGTISTATLTINSNSTIWSAPCTTAAGHAFSGTASGQTEMAVCLFVPIGSNRRARLTGLHIGDGPNRLDAPRELERAWGYYLNRTSENGPWVSHHGLQGTIGVEGWGGYVSAEDIEGAGFELYRVDLSGTMISGMVVPTNGNIRLVFEIFEEDSGTDPVDPTVNWPTGLTAQYGSTLSSITLPGNGSGTAGSFSWVSAGTTLVGGVPSASHQLLFTPSDTAAFNTAQQAVTVSVTPRPLTITGVAATNRVYNRQTTVALTGGALQNVVSGDTVTFNRGEGTMANADVGIGKPVTTAITLSGAPAGNYTLTQPAVTVNITALQLTWNTGARVNDKVFDGNDSATILVSPTLNGVIAGDTVNVSAGTVRFNTPAVGTNKTIIASGWGISGNNNYSAPAAQPVFQTANISIEPVALFGDVNGDGRVDSTDVFLLRRWLAADTAGRTAIENANANFNINAGKVTPGGGLPTADDITRIRRWIAAITKFELAP